MYTPLVGIYILGAIILGPWRGRSDLLLTKMKKIGTETQIDFGSRILHNFNKRWNGSVLRMRELRVRLLYWLSVKSYLWSWHCIEINSHFSLEMLNLIFAWIIDGIKYVRFYLCVFYFKKIVKLVGSIGDSLVV